MRLRRWDRNFKFAALGWHIAGASGYPLCLNRPRGEPMIRSLNFSARVLMGAFALLVLLTAARADAPYSFDTTPGQLPKTVVPIHYTLDLQPDLEALTVAGSL